VAEENRIIPEVLDVSWQLIFMFADGDTIKPDSDIDIGFDAELIVKRDEAMIVVPSQSLHPIFAVPAVSVSVTVPDANHVPGPVVILGPSK
jgi:hypothetical protein